MWCWLRQSENGVASHLTPWLSPLLQNQLRLREEHISSLKVELLDQQDKYKRMTLSLDTAEHQRRVLEMMEMRYDT